MKEKILKGKKKLVSFVLALAMVIGLMPLSSMTVYAESTTSITDGVATKIKNANTTSTYDSTKLNTLYGVGEANLTANDVVTVNGVECYVLSVDTAANTAQLITRNIYDQRFNSTSSNGYDYATSDLKTYMENFYTTTTSGQGLASDSRIIQTNAKYYVGVSTISSTTTPTGTVPQYAYALDAVEAINNMSKFGSSSWINYNACRDSAYTDNCFGFWISAGLDAGAFGVRYSGSLRANLVDDLDYGARPAFTIDLTVSPTTNISGNLNKTTEAYVMTIPAGKSDLDLTDTSSAQSIGDLKITRTDAEKNLGRKFDTQKKVSVTIGSANSGNLKITTTGKTDTLAYTLGIGNTSVTSWTTAPVQDFTASAIDAETAVAMTVKITGDAADVANGTYQDQLTFTASVAPATN